MSARKSITQNLKHPQADDDLELREIFVKYIRYWPIFLVLIMVGMVGAYVYNIIAEPQFDIKATLLLQDGSQTSEIKSPLQSIGIDGASKHFENDVEVLQSRRLISTVVKDLRLWVSYKVVDDHLKKEIYETSPITFNLVRPGNLDQKITVFIKNAYSFSVKTAEDGDDDDGSSYEFNNDVVTSAGIWQLAPTENLRQYIGSTIIIQLNNPERVIDEYQGNLDVALKDQAESSAVDITLKDHIPRRGQDFVNRLISQFNKNEINDKNHRTKIKLDFIDRRLDSLSGELNYAEKQVEQYRSSHGLTDINAQSQSYLESAQNNDGRLADVNIQLRVINDIEDYINAPTVTDKTVPSTIGINDPNLVSLVQSYTDQQRQRSSLLATTPEKNPAFDPINKQIANTRTAIREDINNIKSSLQATRSELLKYGSKYKSSIQSIPGQDRELTALKRLQASKEALYNLLLQKREETAIDYASTLSNASMVDVAYVIAPKAIKALVPFAIALLLGLLIPITTIYLIDVIKNKITTRRSIEKALPIPISGQIEIADLKTPIVTDLDNEKISFMLIEQFRSLRTQLHYLHNNENKGRVTLVASSVAGEGKSFVASNLGVALATSGKRTIILELNIYKPVMSQLFNLPESHPGMSNYLNWESLKEEVIQNTVTYRNLDVIASGQFISNFSELLDRKRIEILLDWLRLHYDHIIIDTSPLQVIGDATIVARLCDITLYVIRKNFTSKNQLSFINNLCVEHQLPNMSVVFNGIDSVKRNYKDYFTTKA